MSLSKKKQKKSTDQPCIDKLDELLWETTPLGKFQKSNIVDDFGHESSPTPGALAKHWNY